MTFEEKPQFGPGELMFQLVRTRNVFICVCGGTVSSKARMTIQLYVGNLDNTTATAENDQWNILISSNTACTWPSSSEFHGIAI